MRAQHNFVKLFITLTLLICTGQISLALTVSNTYTAGDIPTNNFTYSAACNGPATPFTVSLPGGGPWQVTSIDVVYDMTAASGAWKSEQRSKVYCQNTTTGEAAYASGAGTTGGLQNYNRVGLNIANGIYAGGTNLVFEMQAYRTWTGGGTCNTTYNKIDNGTWTITVNYSLSGPMSYVSTTVTQNNTSSVQTCASNQEIIGIEIVTTGSTSPIDATLFRIQTNGSTSPAITTNVSNIDIYYTGTSSTFAPTTLFGNAAPQVAGTNIDITGTQTLSQGTNYFWVVYDINAGANIGDLVDATCQRVTVNSTNYNHPADLAGIPAGSRTISICDPSPGGVGVTDLTAWWKAESLANGNVTSWATSYPTGGSAISVTDGTAPYSQCTNTPTASIFNYNSVVNFSGNDGSNQKQLMNTSALNLLTNQLSTSKGTFFVVHAAPTVGNNDGVVTFKNGQHGIQMRGWGRLALGDGNSSNGTRNFAPKPATQPMIISYKGNKSSGTSMTAFKDDLMFTTSSGSSALMSTGLTFGAKRNTSTSYNEYFTGYLSEVIFFDEDLSIADANKIHTYVGIKYSVTLDNTGGVTQGDYIATDGGTIWDASVNAGYHNDVIGIGRDDNQALLQKQSHTFDDTTRIYLNTLAATNAANGGSFSSDVSYLVVGHNNGVMCGNPAIMGEVPPACSLFSRIEREWKITKTNFSDNFSFDAKLNLCGTPTSVVVAELRLLVDDDGDFSNGGTICYFNGDGFGTVISYSNPVITISGISSIHIANNSTKYITIASTDPNTPLPIKLSSFNANCEGIKTVLNWTTATETNNDYFTIEKSADGINFEEIEKITGNGNSSSPTTYRWENNSPTDRTAYYRLVQTDFNGEYKYLGTKSVSCNQISNILIYPNPTSKMVTIDFGKNYQNVSIQIKNVVGQVIQSNTYESLENLELSLDGKKGIYFITISNGLNKNIYHQKIIKQ